MVFRDGANELSKRENLKWADTIAYYNPVTPNGPKRLVGWDYTPQGGTKTTWTGAPNPIALATIDVYKRQSQHYSEMAGSCVKYDLR